jgi:lipopolysaccharide export system permease protein
VPLKLPRYVLREVMGMYLAGLALFLILQMTDALSSTVGKALTYKATFPETGAAFLGILPTFVNRSLVLAVPFGILLGLSRLQRDSEVKALLAAGVRPLSVIWPLLLPFALVGGVAFVNAGSVVPAGLDRWDRTWYGIFGMASPIPSQDRYTYAPPGALYYAGRVLNDNSGAGAQLSGVMVQRGDEILTAQTGRWNAQAQTWILDSPWVTRTGQAPAQQTGPVTVPQQDRLEPPPPDPKKISNARLRAELARDDLGREARRDYTYQLAARYADPFTPVAFALAAGALGLLFRSRAAATAAVIVFIAGFYVLWETMPTLARSGAVGPEVAAWLPSVLFSLLGLGLAWRLNR